MRSWREKRREENLRVHADTEPSVVHSGKEEEVRGRNQEQ